MRSSSRFGGKYFPPYIEATERHQRPLAAILGLAFGGKYFPPYIEAPLRTVFATLAPCGFGGKYFPPYIEAPAGQRLGGNISPPTLKLKETFQITIAACSLGGNISPPTLKLAAINATAVGLGGNISPPTLKRRTLRPLHILGRRLGGNISPPTLKLHWNSVCDAGTMRVWGEIFPPLH